MTIRQRHAGVRLDVTGLVATPRSWSADDLAGVPGAVADLGEVADGFVGEAVPVAPILAGSEPAPDATHCTVASDDGHYQASIPLADLAGKGWLAFRLDGRPLPRDRGGPLRVVVPRGRTLCWNVKSVAELRLTAGPEPDSVPANPSH